MRLDLFSLCQLGFRLFRCLNWMPLHKPNISVSDPLRRRCSHGEEYPFSAFDASALFEIAGRWLSAALLPEPAGSSSDRNRSFVTDVKAQVIEWPDVYFTRFWGGEYSEHYISGLAR
ncbi:hypothetical protein [Pseudomonas sp. Irchel s3f7]|uniref:hypothetical protein n=1 Tax=Pseudomonas sp. Irchel s3f7 TaxID=2009153 RepID=UPI001179AAAB|nr:hypothetical protein [Pseudomonas sp. Irchel s3f7]